MNNFTRLRSLAHRALCMGKVDHCINNKLRNSRDLKLAIELFDHVAW